MVKYFQFKKKKLQKKDGSERFTGEMYWREKTNTYANKATIEKYIKKNKSVLILGDSDSGKTHSLNKFYKNRALLYPRRMVVLFNATEPIAQWVDDQKDFQEWAKFNKIDMSVQYKRITALKKFCRTQKPVVFLDDSHKLTGRKAQIAKACMHGNIIIATALSENKIMATIRQVITKYETLQRFTLSTTAAFDATKTLSLGLVLVLFALGMPEVAIIAGLFMGLANGRLGSNNN